ncbi:hypothetical protein NQ315_017453 [Exocentrus adspersus]|uniref:Integrase catalytic domain-containing protein n=1 Tax=Exocentrus adspersus TaxID=1586481 RepID=A0AAV8VKQ0_9CUCU|nr:hypothetical protein NQ315_017453 [Exocentrus adspersus]
MKHLKKFNKYATNVKEDIVNELHKPARINFKRRRTIIKGLNDLIQADLIDLISYSKENNGYKYVLIVINCFSKFVWTEPLINKSAQEVANAMNKILQCSKKIPKNLQTDMGKEFYNTNFNKLMKKYKINHYSVYSTKKASIVELSIRTIKNMLWRGEYKWIHILDDIVDKYNNTVHSTTRMKPVKVTARNERSLLKSTYTHLKIANKITKFKVGDHVRIMKYREAFEKGYTPNWSSEIFIIRKIRLSNPTTYLLQDEAGKEITGGFYELELQKAKHPDAHLVEKVLRKKGNKVFVKWLGYNDKHNSWIDSNNVL